MPHKFISWSRTKTSSIAIHVGGLLREISCPEIYARNRFSSGCESPLVGLIT